MIATALTFRGVSNMKDSSKATSERVLDCQHFASSKLEPSLDVKILTSPGAYAQSTFKPDANRREFKTPVQVTPWTGGGATFKQQGAKQSLNGSMRVRYVRMASAGADASAPKLQPPNAIS